MRTDPVATLETISPSMAKSMLNKMVSNRTLSDSRVLEYAIDIDQGRWSINGETIKFDSDGNLFDGQHRLHACILADKSFKSMVVRGLADETAFTTVDVGKNRSHGDIFSIAGFTQANAASATALIIYLHRHEMLSWTGAVGRSKVFARGKSPEITSKMKTMPRVMAIVDKQELLNFALPYRDRIITACSYAQGSKAKRYLPNALIAAAYFLFSEKSELEARAFFDDLGEGVGLLANDPIFALRDRLIGMKQLGVEQKSRRWLILGMVFKIWNKRRLGQKLSKLKIIENEEYPKKLL